ncbi:hypothetical protein PSN45_000408 [Yamadazyma tenuis]|uniref:NAD(P)-binding protein n=1 Tax=Candida tenuis (strain ATCC 10573 / BCRC 21748 / CBS 615 / JCM 9827 / NBRC 10315 / NRRL Y-1498 / VKM Y-70) TaxID=590646 RepID=G3B893_CANTC|nr:NAD(P)-binding protein [Yamadazyma tenuis ATCC 10573]XP_006688802.1 uncharacterized protein CANTEDRAFT_115175 [Yamadazyma tenuis ATCC 10573]EGV62631.1 NAD(P)-binding protein [Yamadazyma tenuis ATCC 10573]EGV62632.1 hypothetical protein CANTEDRAFT_115175 [Yamadazyma tenuis ATCC 10573]WEJ92950.1 hypothetical protein PSN45_000408 [Yamadazyma tenuis]
MVVSDYRKVLVTGGTGFIGAHIVDNLLSLGIRVRLASRSLKKAQQFIDARPETRDLIEAFEIKDFTSLKGNENPFLDAVEGVDGIIHAASPLDYSVANVEEDLIKPAINGVKVVFEAALTEPNIKRVVLTSSFASVMDVSKGPGPGFTYTGDDWNPLTYEESIKADPVIAYRGSKKFAELEAWNFIKERHPSFDLVTFCPPMTFGPIVHPVDVVEDLNLSNATLWDIYKGVSPLPVSRVPVWVDVRDLALAHVKALVVEKASNKRYVPSSPEKFSYNLAAKLMKDNGLGSNITIELPTEGLVPEGYDLDYATVERDLGIKFHSFEDCILDSMKQFQSLPSKK